MIQYLQCLNIIIEINYEEPFQFDRLLSLPISMFWLDELPQNTNQPSVSVRLRRAKSESERSWIQIPAGRRITVHGGEKDYLRVYATEYNTGKVRALVFEDGSSIEINGEKQHIICMYTTQESYAVRALLKNITLEYLYNDGWVPLHAAAIAIKGKGFLLLGEKGSGKTTRMMSMVLLGMQCGFEIRCISNDRVMIKRINDKWHFISLDAMIRIDDNTIRLLRDTYDRTFTSVFTTQRSAILKGKTGYWLTDLGENGFPVIHGGELYGVINCSVGENMKISVGDSSLPGHAFVDDEEEHPNWLSIVERNNQIQAENLKQEQFASIEFQSGGELCKSTKSLYDLCK